MGSGTASTRRGPTRRESSSRPPTNGQDPTALAQVYATLATSDQVTKAAILRHRIRGSLLADFGYINRTSTVLPTISVTAISATPERAATLANDAVDALAGVRRSAADRLGIPVEKQATLKTLNTAIPFGRKCTRRVARRLP